MGSRCSLVLALVATVGCGRIDFDLLGGQVGGDDAGTDTGVSDTGSSICTPWMNITRQTLFATAADDWEVAFHPNGLALVFTSTVTDSDLYISTRATTNDSFGPPMAIASLNTTSLEYGVAWSPDGSRLYFVRNNLVTPLYLMATYNGGSSFTNIRTSDLPDGFSWDLQVGELEVFFTTEPANQDFDLHRSTRPAIGMPWVEDNAFYTMFNRTGVNMNDGWPSFDRAHQTLYFERTESGGGRIVTIQRAGPGQPFQPSVDVSELVGNGEAGDPDISPDGLTLAFDSTRTGGTGGNDIYFTTRTCN